MTTPRFDAFTTALVAAKAQHLTDAATICQARDDGAIAQLVRILGESPAGAARARELLVRACEPLRPM